MKAKGSDTYDKIYSKSKKYKAHYRHSPYYDMWDQAFRLIPDGSSVVDIGCGTGQFARLCADRNVIHYTGMDFSQVAIDMARVICPEFTFRCVDVTDSLIFNLDKGDVIVMLEFLEHIDDDIGLLKKIPKDTRIVASVPNYMCSTHVRCFPSVTDIHKRYGALLRFADMYTFPGKKGHKITLFESTKK